MEKRGEIDLSMNYIHYGRGFENSDHLDPYPVCMKMILKTHCFILDHPLGLPMMAYRYSTLVNKTMCAAHYCRCEQADY